MTPVARLYWFGLMPRDTGLIPEVVSVMRHWVARDLPCMRILFPHTWCGVRPIVSLDVEQDSRTVVYSVSRQDH